LSFTELALMWVMALMDRHMQCSSNLTVHFALMIAAIYACSDGSGTSANQLESIEEDENVPSTTTRLGRVRMSTLS